MRILLALWVLLVSLPGSVLAADDKIFGDAVYALNAEGFAEKAAAVENLARLGDERSTKVLSALLEGRLLIRNDAVLLIDSGESLIDPVSGQKIEGPDKSDYSPLTLNNRVRGVLRSALAASDISNPDPKARLAAIRSVADSQGRSSAPTLRNALETEREPAIAAELTQILAGFDLHSSDKSARLTAIAALSGTAGPGNLARIKELLTTEQNMEVRKAAGNAVSSIENRLMAVGFAANLFQGLSLGSVLLLAAIGLAITFGVMGVINMAHGEMIMLGAYTTFAVQQFFRLFLPSPFLDLYLVAALPIAFVVTFLVGMALERGVIRFLYGRPLETLLATFGISLILQQVVRSIFGATNVEVANPIWMTGGIELASGFTLTWNRVAIVLFSFAVMGGLAALLRYSSFGLQMRAVSMNRPMANAMGIRSGMIDAATFGLGSGIAGVAGVALSQIGNVSPNLGQGYIVDSFMVVVFGGVGSLWGTLVGALSLGIVNKFLEPFSGAILGKILVLVFIILFIQKRPRGLSAQKGRSVEG